MKRRSSFIISIDIRSDAETDCILCNATQIEAGGDESSSQWRAGNAGGWGNLGFHEDDGAFFWAGK